MDNFTIASQFIHALTGDINAVIDWRVIHDKNKGELARNMRASLSEMWQTLNDYNNAGWGVFCNINALDGNGYELANVAACRVQVVDLDNPVTSNADYGRAIASNPAPQFTVQTSQDKFHIYWRVVPYKGNDFYTLMQRKLLQLYNGDKQIIDATRVMRVPGFYHRKADPVLVTFTALTAFDHIHTHESLNTALEHVNVIDHFSSRHPLGTVEMQAPSFDWLRFVLTLIDPNDLDRAEWLSITAAIKQAGWSHTDEPTLRGLWETWCARYKLNDAPENLKLWNSIRDTEVGWTSLERRSTVKAYMQFGFKEPPPAPAIVDAGAMLQAQAVDTSSEILDNTQTQEYFKDCYYVGRLNAIFSRGGRYMDQAKFNGVKGGKTFIIDSVGKTTDNAWTAAVANKIKNIPKVDHVRFLPEKELFHVQLDALGREGINTYIPAKVKIREGDVKPFLNHVAKILPNADDRKLFLDYLAHCVKYPGYKIPWSPMLQSAEGVGKTAFFEVMQYALGDMYVYRPKAPELVKSGSTFNAWMRAKLLIVVDEIKIDERRELIEILKPMITDARVEIQSKGVDQDMEDNAANWLFFSNYKDAIPINQNGRRYAIFYSALQSKADIIAAGMDGQYFTNFFKWLENEGREIVAWWFKNYPIGRGDLAVRAPETSSYDEALRLSRSPMEVIIADSVLDAVPGFRGGYISVVATVNRCKAAGLRNVTAKAVGSCLESIGYSRIGRAVRPYIQEDMQHRSELFSLIPTLPFTDYGKAQGYE